MTFAWTPHRFSGGALALDVANSVVLRAFPDRRIDRFADPAVELGLPADAETWPLDTAGYNAFIQAEVEKWAPLVRASGASVE